MSIYELSDEELAEKFRREYNEQFHILVRMHLSFVLDLNTDENECLNEKNKLKKWKLVPFSAKKVKYNGIMDGAPLTQEGICQVYQLIEFLRKEQNIVAEGIFRRTGSLARQQELRNLLNQGAVLNLENGHFNVHDCASVLKGFLAELPDPLLTEAHFPAYCQIAELCGVVEKPTQDNKLLEALQLILLLLPSENKVLLKDLLDLLHLTTTYESNNRMSADNLATLFTPHLLCPRKLSPEQLHVNSQTLCGIISFMIKNYKSLFKIPSKLIVDFRVRYEKRKMLHPSKRLNESVSDQFAANTVFTFVDHERTTKENEANPTETALAQLYAHIQSLPESSKKRKLVKQFNKENGFGTPLQVVRSNVPKNKSFGDSIKKHIFQKGLQKIGRRNGFTQLRSSSEEMLHTPTHQQQSLIAKAKLFCTNCETSTDDANNEDVSKKLKHECPVKSDDTPVLKRSMSESDITNVLMDAHCVTSTPACVKSETNSLPFTPDGIDGKDGASMSPITRSTKRMSRAMQETMMTPRSRKPILLVSGTNINSLPKIEPAMINLQEESSSATSPKCNDSVRKSRSESDIIEYTKEMSPETTQPLTDTFKEYFKSRNLETYSLADSSFSSRTDDFNSNPEYANLSESKMSESMLFCLDGNIPADMNDSDLDEHQEKELVLKPKQFDKNGRPTVYETSF